MPKLIATPNPVLPGKRYGLRGEGYTASVSVKVGSAAAKTYLPTPDGVFEFGLIAPSRTGTVSITASSGGASLILLVNVANPTPPPPPPPPPPQPDLTFKTSIPEGTELSGSTTPWTAGVLTGTADHIDFLIDGVLHWSEAFTPWGGPLDTLPLANGPHELVVIGYDLNHALAQVKQTTHVSVNNVAPPPPPPPPPPTTGTRYGPAIGADTKSNIQNHSKVAHRFVATGSRIMSARFQQRGGDVYSGGNGGRVKIGIQGDAGGHPDGTWVGATATYAPGNQGSTGWTKYDAVAIDATVAPGKTYYLVFENTDPSPQSNYFSINEIFMYKESPLYQGQRQPKWPDADVAALDFNNGAWVTHRETPVHDLGYSDGSHQGQGYVGMIGGIPGLPGSAVSYATISGANRVRSTIKPKTPIVFSKGAVRVRHISGTDPLVITAYDDNGGAISVSVPAAQIQITIDPKTGQVIPPGGDNGGAVWVPFDFGHSFQIVSGGLRVETATALYTASPIRAGTDVGFDPSLSFPDGEFQISVDSGNTWKSPYAGSILDLQFFLE